MTSEQLVIGLVSISDRASSGVYEDKGIPALEAWLASALSSPWRVETRLIADDQATHQSELCADRHSVAPSCRYPQAGVNHQSARSAKVNQGNAGRRPRCRRQGQSRRNFCRCALLYRSDWRPLRGNQRGRHQGLPAKVGNPRQINWRRLYFRQQHLLDNTQPIARQLKIADLFEQGNRRQQMAPGIFCVFQAFSQIKRSQRQDDTHFA
jgi:hypothetical protein